MSEQQMCLFIPWREDSEEILRVRVQRIDLIPMDSQASFDFPLHAGGSWRLLNKRM